jgi:RNA polymerase sigma factor (sigma-70 family)
VKRVALAPADLLTKYERLVQRVALPFSHRFPRAALPDLMQEGRMGLLRAGELYRKRKGATFATYAHHHIAKRVREAARASNLVHVPDRKLRKGVMAHVDGGLEGFRKLAELGSDGGISRAHAAASVKRLLTKLPAPEARVLHLRYLNGQLTKRQVAKKLRHAVSTVHLLERSAFARLRRASLRRK